MIELSLTRIFKSPSALAPHLSKVRVDHSLGLFAPAWYPSSLDCLWARLGLLRLRQCGLQRAIFSSFQ